MKARPFLLFIYRNLPKPVKRAIVRTLFPTYIIAAKVYLVNNEGKFLAVNTTYNPGWDIPSGHCDKGESPDSAAARELFEETGIKADNLQQKSVVFQPIMGTVQVIFTGVLDHSPQPKADNVEISEVRWVEHGEVNLNPYALEALEVLLVKKASYWVSDIDK